jgi:hypothetical protein
MGTIGATCCKKKIATMVSAGGTFNRNVPSVRCRGVGLATHQSY